MKYSEEFASNYSCEAPEGLPANLKERLAFISCLAESQSRAVYLVKGKNTNEKAVLKINKPGSSNSVLRECELLRKLEHPAIPKALLCETDEEGREYLLRSYAEGDTLDRLIERDGVFDEHHVLEITQKLCDILSYLHGQTPPIIYRDIKPQNIVMTQNGKLTLIDFGISREDRADKDFDTVYVGSVAFAAPEQFGFTKTDSRSDVFSLGKLMLYLSTGSTRLPDFKQRVTSRKLAGLIAKCTSLSPDKRYASVTRLSRAIHRILYPPSRGEILAGGLAAALVLGLGFFVLWQTYLRQSEVPVVEGAVAVGEGWEDEVKIPVLIETLWHGEPFADCAVAVDNHQWYAPASNGKAELYIYAYDEYRIRAVYQNQTAYVLSPVMRDTGALSFTFDFAEVPSAPEYLPLQLAFGETHEVPLPVDLADEVTLSGQPEGLSVIQKEDGQFYLIVDATVADPGHYMIFAEAVNGQGKADVVLGLHLTQEKPVILVRTAQDLWNIRNDLSGHYELAADIDLSGYERWTPIGNGMQTFTGVLDGKGHTITGLACSMYPSNDAFRMGLFGIVDGGIVRGLVIRDAEMAAAWSGHGGAAILAGENRNGLIEYCAVIGGQVEADISLESAAAGVAGINTGIVRQCFNSTTVIIFTASGQASSDSFASGICGVNNGYLADCGNTGDVTGVSLAGGVSAFNDMGIVTRCYNAGRVKAPTYPPSFLPGGIAHLLGRGKTVSYCAFEEGTAQVGANVYNGGTLLFITPLSRNSLRDLDELHAALHVDAAQEGFVRASLDSPYPLPAEIFTGQMEAPPLPESGGAIALPMLDGVQYFFTTDGSDPRQSDVEGVERVDIVLGPGETLRVFAAKQGFMDSEVVAYAAEGG